MAGLGAAAASGLPGAQGPPTSADLDEALRGHLRTVFQPVVALDTRQVVAFEALTRGPRGSRLEAPQALFAAAELAGVLAELETVALRRALRAAGRAGVRTLFVNLEPATVAAASTGLLDEVVAEVEDGATVVVEVTERALLRRPAELLAGAEHLRGRGWRIALDDVGAERSALALLPFLRPDVIKLDLQLVQGRPTLEIAEIVNAVNAQAAETGATLLAEGVEHPAQAARAVGMGARYAQGYAFGAPATLADAGPQSPLLLPGGHGDLAPELEDPFAVVAAAAPLRRIEKPMLAAISRHVERQALLLGDSAVVLAAFQHARNLTGPTLLRYGQLAQVAALVSVCAVGMPEEPAVGVRGSELAPDDPAAAEWVVTVIGAHFAAALAAREAGTTAEGRRLLEYAVTYDRAVAVRTATALLRRTAGSGGSQPAGRHPPGRTRPSLATSPPPRRLPAADLPDLLLRAIETAHNPITIADARQPDMPLVYANEAFLRLTGYTEEECLGRNCRFLQGAGTDGETVAPVRRRLAAGLGVQAVLLNYRRDGRPFWNELRVSPVHDDTGATTHFIGNQLDVTERVLQEQRTSHLAYHDPLTGLPNRASLREHLRLQVQHLARTGDALALLYLDLDGFEAVNDAHGHHAGDLVLTEAAHRMQRVTRAGELLARHGGDEFVLCLSTSRHQLRDAAHRLAGDLLRALGEPFPVGPPVATESVSISASVGLAVCPDDATTGEDLLAAADAALYRAKRGRKAVEWYAAPP